MTDYSARLIERRGEILAQTGAPTPRISSAAASRALTSQPFTAPQATTNREDNAKHLMERRGLTMAPRASM